MMMMNAKSKLDSTSLVYADPDPMAGWQMYDLGSYNH